MTVTQPQPKNGNHLDTGEQVMFTPGTRPVPPVPPLPSAITGEKPMPVRVPVNPPVESFAPAEPAGQLPAVDDQLLHDLQKAVATDISNEHLPVSKRDLAMMLEGFARVIRGDVHVPVVSADNHSAEIAEMKELLLQAQETIISLLNDRVFDRAKISRLESESRLMPDLQAQATRAMGLAMRTDEFQQELVTMKAELERLRTSCIRGDFEPQQQKAWWQRLIG